MPLSRIRKDDTRGHGTREKRSGTMERHPPIHQGKKTQGIALSA